MQLLVIISDVNMVIESQLHSDFQACEYFSVTLDESCDIQDKPRLAIFARFISTDCLIKEELLDIVPLTLSLPRSSINDLVFSVFTSNFFKLSYKISLLKNRFVTLFFIRFS